MNDSQKIIKNIIGFQAISKSNIWKYLKMSTVKVVAHMEAKQGKEAELRAVLEAFVAPTRLEEVILIQMQLCVEYFP